MTLKTTIKNYSKGLTLIKVLFLIFLATIILTPHRSLAVIGPTYHPVDNTQPFAFIAVNRQTRACIGAIENNEAGEVTTFSGYWDIIASGHPQSASTPFGPCYAYVDKSPYSYYISSCCERAGYKVIEDQQIEQDLHGDLGWETWFYKEKTTNREITICADEKTKREPFCEGKTAQNVTAEDTTSCEYHPTGLVVDAAAKTCGVAFEASEYLRDVYVPSENLSGSGSQFRITVDYTQRVPQGTECPAIQPIAGDIIHFGPAANGYLDPSGKVFSAISEGKTLADYCRELGYHLVTLADVKTKRIDPYIGDRPVSEPWLTIFRYLGNILPVVIFLGVLTFVITLFLWVINRKNSRGSRFRRWTTFSIISTVILMILWFVVIFFAATAA